MVDPPATVCQVTAEPEYFSHNHISCVMLILRAALNMSLNEAPAMLDAGGSGAVIVEADLRPRPAPGGSRAARPATEGDLLICKRTRPVLILKEREIRSVPAVRLAGKSAADTVAVMMAVLRRLDPRLRSSVTFDNHTAFARHGLLTSACAMTTWFRDAYASWQKGVVENAKGRLRRDLPRDLDTPGDAELREIVLSHNTGHLGFHGLGRPSEKTLYYKDVPKRDRLK